MYEKSDVRNVCVFRVAAYIRIVSLLDEIRAWDYSDIRQFSRRTRWIVAGQVNSGQRPHLPSSKFPSHSHYHLSFLLYPNFPPFPMTIVRRFFSSKDPMHSFIASFLLNFENYLILMTID